MNSLRKTICSLAFSGLLLLCAALPGRAGQPVLSDPLTAWPLNFGAQSSYIGMKNGALHITMEAGHADWASYNGLTFADMDASVTVKALNPDGNAAGLLFWVTAPNDFYDFSVSDSGGSFAIVRHSSTSASPWDTIVAYTPSAAINKGAGAVNTLRVVTKGNYISLFINGQSIGSLSLMAPASGGTVGIEGEGGAKGSCDYVFSNMMVSQ